MPRNKLKRERLIAKRRRKAVKRQKVLARRGTRSKAGQYADHTINNMIASANMLFSLPEMLQGFRRRE